MDDVSLLRRYVEHSDHEAFGRLVERHFNVVYFAALRQVGGDSHRARDVAQEVFATLARKASGLLGRANLVGWLYTSARFAAFHAVRREMRRMDREHKAAERAVVAEGPEAPVDWDRIKPQIDSVLEDLSGRERELVLMRFFQGRTFGEIAESQGTTPDAARFRLDRALNRMKSAFGRRGVASTTAALATALESQAGMAAPPGMSAQVAAGALAGAGPAASIGLGTLLEFMTMAKTATSGAALILGALILAEAFWGHRQAAEVQELRRAQQAAAADPTPGEVTRASAQLAALEAARVKAAANAGPGAGGAAGTAAAGGNSAAAANPFAFALLRGMYSQDFRDVMAQAQKSRLNMFYAPLFQQLNLSPADLDKFKELLVDKQFSVGDANRSALGQGMGYDDSRQVIRYAQADIDHDLQTLLGDQGYATYEAYESTRAQRFLVNELQQRLEGSSTPLTGEQSAQLVAIWHASAPVTNPPPTAGMGAQPASGIRWRDPSMPLSDDSVAAAAALLAPSQMNALRRIQEQQQAAAQLRQMGVVVGP